MLVNVRLFRLLLTCTGMLAMQMITRLFPSQCNVYSKGPVGDNCFHIALLLNTPSTLAIAKYLVKLYGKTLVNTPYQVSWLHACCPCCMPLLITAMQTCPVIQRWMAAGAQT